MWTVVLGAAARPRPTRLEKVVETRAAALRAARPGSAPRFPIFMIDGLSI